MTSLIFSFEYTTRMCTGTTSVARKVYTAALTTRLRNPHEVMIAVIGQTVGPLPTLQAVVTAPRLADDLSFLLFLSPPHSVNLDICLGQL